MHHKVSFYNWKYFLQILSLDVERNSKNEKEFFF